MNYHCLLPRLFQNKYMNPKLPPSSGISWWSPIPEVINQAHFFLFYNFMITQGQLGTATCLGKISLSDLPMYKPMDTDRVVRGGV